MAKVAKRRDKWVLDYRDENGIRRWETTDLTKHEAENRLAERLIEVERLRKIIASGEPLPVAPEEKTFTVVKGAYLKSRVKIRESTRKDYEALFTHHLVPFFGNRKVRSITLADVEKWQADLIAKKVGQRTINKAHIQLGALLRYALKHKLVTENVARDMEKMPDKKAGEYTPIDESIFTPAEVNRILLHADDRWRPVILMAVRTGLRQGELLGLKWGDIDWESKRVHVRQQFSKGKFTDLKTTSSRRWVGLSADLIVALKEWKLRCPKGELDLVFPQDNGQPLNHGILLRVGYYPALRRAKLRHINFHGLRHTFASLLIHANVHPKRIQALMGHSTIRVTMDTYGHLMHDADNDAAEKIANLFGSKLVANQPGELTTTQKSPENGEAGVGFEPASTALQAAA